MDEVPVAALAPLVVLVVGWVAWRWWGHRPPPGPLPAQVGLGAGLRVSIPLGGVVYLLVGREPR